MKNPKTLEATFATVDFDENLLTFRLPEWVICRHKWRAGKAWIDASEIMLEIDGQLKLKPQEDGISVDYDLMDQQLKSLGDAITFLHADASPKTLDQIDGVINVEHLEGLYELCCGIYEQKPFPERKDSSLMKQCEQAMPQKRLRVPEADLQLALDTLVEAGDVGAVQSQLEGLLQCAPDDDTKQLRDLVAEFVADIEAAYPPGTSAEPDLNDDWLDLGATYRKAKAVLGPTK